MTHVIVSTAPVVGDWQRRAEKAEAENANLRGLLGQALWSAGYFKAIEKELESLK